MARARVRPAGADGAQPPSRWARFASWWRDEIWNAPWAVFLVLFAGAVVAHLLLWRHPGWRESTARAYAVILFTLAPALLYLRFVRFRLLPVCIDYVYNLHRLRVDEPKYLPEPPKGSRYHDRWVTDGGPGYARFHDNVYIVKFETHYAPWPKHPDDAAAAAAIERPTIGSLMSLYLFTATSAVGWAAVIWYLPTLTTAHGLWAAERFAFLGAYFYVLSMLVRRYFQNDLRLSAYITGSARVLTVAILVAAVEEVWGVVVDPGQPTRNVVAFLVGVFPSVAMQLLRRSVGKVTGWLRGGLEPPLPLNQLDGMDIWTEARLLEVGIEDVQHLATTNLVDLCLSTRIETQRLVDWVDQGLLLLYAGMPRIDNIEQETTYRQLRDIGVRTAWQLTRCVHRLQLGPPPDGPYEVIGATLRGAEAARCRRRKEAAGTGTEPPASAADDQRLGRALGLKAVVIADAVEAHPNLNLIRNWYTDGFPEEHRVPGAEKRSDRRRVAPGQREVRPDLVAPAAQPVASTSDGGPRTER